MAPTALDLSLGAIEMGVLISSVFYGNFVVQCYIFSQSSIKNRLWIKLLVSLVLLLETLHTALIWVYLYDISVTNYGHPAALENLGAWHVDLSFTAQGLVGSAVQAFFSYRTWVVSGTIWFAIPGWIGELVRAGLSVALTVTTMTMKGLTTSEFRKEYDWMGTSSCVLSAVIDIWNTALLCYYLRALHSNLRFRRTTQIVNKLTIWSIETGLFTSIVAVVLVVFLVGQRENAVWIGVLFIYAKVYSNSLLVSLNARQAIRAMEEAPQTTGAIITIGSVPPSTERTLDLELARMKHEEGKHRVIPSQTPVIATDIECDEPRADRDLIKCPPEW